MMNGVVTPVVLEVKRGTEASFLLRLYGERLPELLGSLYRRFRLKESSENKSYKRPSVVKYHIMEGAVTVGASFVNAAASGYNQPSALGTAGGQTVANQETEKFNG